MSTALSTTVNPKPPVSLTRSFVALGTLLGCFTAMFVNTSTSLSSASPDRWEDFVLLFFGVALVAAPFAARAKNLASQIFSRAVLLQLSVFGGLVIAQTFVRDNGFDSDSFFGGVCLVAAGALPLLVIGKRGFNLQSDQFKPGAFRATLLASLVFGLADTWALLFYSLMESGSFPMLTCAAVMSIALFGLYRLKVWGLVLCISANLVVAGLALLGFFGLPDVLTYGLAFTAAIQLALPLPLIVRIVRG